MKKHIIVYSMLFLWAIGLQAQNKKYETTFAQGVLELCLEGNIKIVGTSESKLKVRSVGKSRNYQLYANIPGISGNSSASDSLFRYRLNNFWLGARKKKGLQQLGDKKTNSKDNPYTKQSELFKQKRKQTKMVYILQKEDHKVTIRLGEEKDVKLGETFLPIGKELLIEVPHQIALEINSMYCINRKQDRLQIWKSLWKVSDFNGKLTMSLSSGHIHLQDVVGPVIANTLDGSINVVFDHKAPTALYSLISNDGFIHLETSKGHAFQAEVQGANIYSNLSFDIQQETIEQGIKKMQLQRNQGGPLIMVNAGYGDVYLRKG